MTCRLATVEEKSLKSKGWPALTTIVARLLPVRLFERAGVGPVTSACAKPSADAMMSVTCTSACAAGRAAHCTAKSPNAWMPTSSFSRDHGQASHLLVAHVVRHVVGVLVLVAEFDVLGHCLAHLGGGHRQGTSCDREWSSECSGTALSSAKDA